MGGHEMIIVLTTFFLSPIGPFLTAVKEMTKGHVFDEGLLSSMSGPAQGVGSKRFQAVGYQHQKPLKNSWMGRSRFIPGTIQTAFMQGRPGRKTSGT